MKYLIIAFGLIGCVNAQASGVCNSLKIKSLRTFGDYVYVIPEKVGNTSSSFDRFWHFDLKQSSQAELISAAKLAFSLNKSITFAYDGTNDDGEILTGAPSCNTVALYNWETGARINSITIESN